MECSLSLSFFLSQLRQPVVNSGYKGTSNKATTESVRQSDQAPHEGYPVSDQELAEERKVWTHDWSTLHHKPVCGNEEANSCHKSGDEAREGRVQPQKPCEDDLLKALILRTVLSVDDHC